MCIFGRKLSHVWNGVLEHENILLKNGFYLAFIGVSTRLFLFLQLNPTPPKKAGLAGLETMNPETRLVGRDVDVRRAFREAPPQVAKSVPMAFYI